MALTQEEFEYLKKLKKRFENSDLIYLDNNWSREIISDNSNDRFLLDYYKGTLRLEKYTYNKRYRKSIVLLRFDSVGRHANPDGKIIEGPHVHIYKEGYDDKFAYPPEQIDVDASKMKRDGILRKFVSYFNVTNCPQIQLSIT